MSTSYRINSIFYSLQGEGHNTGRAALFVRFSGCNLRCPFCDTDFASFREMTAEEIVAALALAAPSLSSASAPSAVSASGGFAAGCRPSLPMVVLTGGEPTLQADEPLIDLLHQQGFFVAMESNGTRPAPTNLDWLTVSPKNWWKTEGDGLKVKGDGLKMKGEWWRENLSAISELKLVFDEDTPARLSSLHLPPSTLHLSPSTLHLYLQPCDTGDPARNTAIVRLCVEYIKHHPQWRLSLQTHKLIGIE